MYVKEYEKQFWNNCLLRKIIINMTESVNNKCSWRRNIYDTIRKLYMHYENC